jgi:carbonic anhydrase
VSETDRLVENARAYAERFEGSNLSAPPSKRVAVLACMDARLIPSRILGLNEGDAHVIRNAGGIVTEDAIRSLALSQHLLGTEEIVLIHHTDCGMLTVTDEEFAAKLERDAGRTPEWSAGAFSDLEQSVRDSVTRLRQSPFIPNRDNIRGFVYDVKTGDLSEIT